MVAAYLKVGKLQSFDARLAYKAADLIMERMHVAGRNTPHALALRTFV